jgi:hypothetical protein
MTLFYFNLRDGTDGVRDPDGTDLPDSNAAYWEAEQIAHDLMRNVERRPRHWQLEIHDADDRLLFAMPFAAVDRTLANFEPRARRLIERHAEIARALLETQHRSRVLIRRSRAIIARSKKRPYLAACRGARV